jgi:hypothetical protein
MPPGNPAPTLGDMSERETETVTLELPKAVVAILRKRAEDEKLSLDLYLQDLLHKITREPTMKEVYLRSWPRPWNVDGRTLQQVVREAREEAR